MTETVLLVDDDPDFVALIAPALEQHDLQVLCAGSVQEAEAWLAQGSPDLLVIDGTLPDGNGIDLIRKLRADGSPLPIIFISLYWRDDPTFDLLTRQLDVLLVLHKPFSPAELVAGARMALGRSRVPGDPGPGEPDDAAALERDELDELDEGLLEYRRAYATTLPSKLAELGRLVSEAVQQPEDVKLLRKVNYLAHKLHGTAGSYGFLEVSEAAGRVERTTVDLLDRQQPPSQETWSEIAIALDAAAAAMHWTLPADLQTLPDDTPELRSRILYPRVLVVDDDPDFLREVARHGRNNMMEMVLASTEAEALERSRLTRPDLALIDLYLAEGDDSFRLARLLRSMQGGRQLPIAFVSADSALTSRIVAAQAGGSLFLTKPLVAEELVTAVRQLSASRDQVRHSVLVVDDGQLGDLPTRVLAPEGLEVTTIADPRKVLDALADVRPDLLLLGVRLPHMSGFDLCRMLRATLRWRDLPVLLLALHATPALRATAFEAGADDYLAHPIVTEELLVRVRGLLERRRLRRERADRDLLTGLLARRAILEALTARLAEAGRRNTRLALILLDLDGFKRVNDSYGHLAGDRVLAGLGQLLGSRFRAEDLRGRWGGEEFMVALVDADAEQAARIMEHTLAEFRAISFADDRGEHFQVTFSAGVASFPADGRTPEQLIKAADDRLYTAKAAGANRVEA